MSAQSAAVWCCTSCGAVYHKDFPRCPNDGAEVLLAERDPLLDQRFGHYVVDRLIGEGGMGRVYAAHHATLPAKRYAIKVLLGDVAATSSMRRRFAKEAESASQLAHPNIVQVLDFGEMPSGLPYIVMDYVDGVPLTSLFDGCPMDPARVIHIARAVCEGLAYAHESGVVHRDLKPDNIMVVIGSDGREVPRIADFGLATTVEPNGGARLTTTGMAMGTPAYAAPEQMAGKRVDGRADLYSLGMTMFEMLTGGKLPFEGHPLELMTAKAHREAPRITAIAPALQLPAGLEDLIAHLIRRQYVDRPASSRAVLAALDRIAAGAGIQHVAGSGYDSAGAIADRRATKVGAGGWSERLFSRGKRRKSRSAGRKTFQIRRGTRIWPWLLIAGGAFGAIIGWVRERGTTSSAIHAASQELVAEASPPIRGADPKIVIDPAAIELDPPPRALADASEQSAKRGERTVRSGNAPARNADRSPTSRKVATSESEAGRAPEPLQAASRSPFPPDGGSRPAVAQSLGTPPSMMKVEIADLDVSGGLSRALVRNAVERVMPAIRECTSSVPRTVQTHFTIDESRRAQNVRGTSGCVVAALGGVRIQTMPDVGDAEVDLQIRFSQQP